MSVQEQIPDEHPMMIAWKNYEASDGYRNSWNWAAHEQHRDGSMWAAFIAGYQAAQTKQD